MKCIESNKICPMNNLKCKECALLDCKNTLKMIEEEEEMYYNRQEHELIKQMQRQYPSCVVSGKLCTHLEVLDLEKGKVRCSYMINRKCSLGGNYVSKSNR